MNRRKFIQITSLYSGGALLFSSLPIKSSPHSSNSDYFQPHPLIKLCPDGSIIIYVRKQEMGQGINTSLPLIVAEEMEADWQTIKSEIAPFDYEKKGDYTTVASDSVGSNWEPLRKAGASAREMLVAAAAQQWNVEKQSCQAEKGKVTNVLTGETIAFKNLIAMASKLPVPANPPLKNYKDFRIVGKGAKRINALEIVTGKTKFGIDAKFPGMLYALVLRCPVYEGKIKSYNADAAKKFEGVEAIVEIKNMGPAVGGRNGIAVVADSFWTAQKARDALQVIWDEGENAEVSSDIYSQKLRQKINEDPTIILSEKGKAEELFQSSSTKLVSEYEFPFLGHGCLEPANCTAIHKDGKFEIWGGFQAPAFVADRLPALFGIRREDLTIHLMMMGGGFGRRSGIDYAAEAMQISKAVTKPVKLYWTRTDDTQFDHYRPATYHQLSASLDQNKNITSWQDKVAGTPFTLKKLVKDYDHSRILIEANGGAAGDLHYPVNDFKNSFYLQSPPVPCGAWRSVGYSHNNFAVECFIDELAVEATMNPLDFRIKLLSQFDDQSIIGIRKLEYQPKRLIGVLRKVAEEIGWDNSKRKGHFYGIACCPYLSAKSYAAHAFDISVNRKKKITIHKIVGAIDCGFVIDPDGVRSQMEGALVWALSAVLKGEITLIDGRVQQSNLKDCGIMRFDELPNAAIHIIDSKEDPGSVGEVGVPSVAPALCNALFAATKQRIRKLPVSTAGFSI
jgi:isoquinoline 1-oxidoreductase subunit beta